MTLPLKVCLCKNEGEKPVQFSTTYDVFCLGMQDQALNRLICGPQHLNRTELKQIELWRPLSTKQSLTKFCHVHAWAHTQLNPCPAFLYHLKSILIVSNLLDVLLLLLMLRVCYITRQKLLTEGLKFTMTKWLNMSKVSHWRSSRQ